MTDQSSMLHSRLAKPLAIFSLADLVRVAIVIALVVFAVATPGFLTQPSIRTLLSSMSLVGCVGIGMTFITLSGNIMSFSLGASLATSTIVFVAVLPWGAWLAFATTLAFGAFLNGLQGWIIGYFRANPIIVTMAALSLVIGIASVVTGGSGIYITDDKAAIFTANFGPVPGPLAVMLICAVIGQGVLSYTLIGRCIVLSGANHAAFLAAGMEPWKYTTWAFAIAGAFTSVSAVLIASRYGSGELLHGAGFEYGAITSVLVGGTLIQGGSGSVVRTVFGGLVVAVFQAILLLRGISTEVQQLALGILVLLVVMIQWRGRSR